MFPIQHTVTDRFLRYVKVDTQSDPESSNFPSTEKQKDLSRLLVEELKNMGITDAHLDEFGYVYATLPSNTDKKVPVICFCAHVDTSPDCSGENVRPVIHKNYQGGNIVLPADPTQILTPEDHPEMLNQIGNDIITADGTTLLGADNKAGVAEIMDAAYFLITHPEVKHGVIKILFTPDEEIGRGVDKLDLKKLGADFAYTMDGETLGHIENETFSADLVTIELNGFSVHPGYAKGKMESAIKMAAAVIDSLPKDHSSPETTEGREGFVHPVSVSGTIEQAILKIIIRSFETRQLKEFEKMIENTVQQVMKDFPKSSYRFAITEQYRNFKEVLDKHPRLIEYAAEAVKRAGVKPHLTIIRGGTDGSRLSFMGLPCPNLFAGEHAFHGKHEWVSIQDMQKAAETIIHLCMIWEEKSQ